MGIESLSAWERNVVQHTTPFVDPCTINVEIQRGGFRGVSDGSANPPFQTSYGWVMSSRSGEQAVQGMGPVRGHILHSCCAEGTVMFSVLRVFRLREFTFMEGFVATDSESLLNTLSGIAMKQLRQDIPLDLDFSRVILDIIVPKWDILIEIQKFLKQLTLVQLEYTPGHQDWLRAYETLPLLGQLNDDTDRIASKYQEEFLSHTHTFRVVAKCKSQPGVSTWDSNVSTCRALELALSREPLKEYVRTRSHWTMFDFETILNWNVH